MIVGAQKAGTSSLASYLDQHPQICSHRRREISYFVDDPDYLLGYSANFRRYFSHCSGDAILLGKSVMVMTDRRYVERLHEHNPKVQIMVVLRDPVDRAYSAYWWARQMGYENRSRFDLVLATATSGRQSHTARARNTAYLENGVYAPQIRMLLDIFGRSQVQVHLFDDLRTDATGVCRRVFSFLGVDEHFNPDVSGHENAASRPRSQRLAAVVSTHSRLKRSVRRILPDNMVEALKGGVRRWNAQAFDPPPMPVDTRERLSGFYEPFNAELGEIIGRDLSHWGTSQDVQRQADTSSA